MANNFYATWSFISNSCYISAIVFFILGSCIGSFINAIIYRIPNGIGIAFPKSHCPNCKNQLKKYQNIPLFSWLFLKGKCFFCKIKIPSRYFWIELFTASIFSFSGCFLLINNFNFLAIVKFFALLTLLIPLFFIDLKYKALPNKLTYTGIILGIIFAFFPKSNLIYESTSYHLSSGLYLFLFIAFIIEFGKKITGNKTEIMGYGDAKLITMIGLFLGLWLSLIILLLASLMSQFVYIFKKEKTIAWGSYLTLTCFLSYIGYLIVNNNIL